MAQPSPAGTIVPAGGRPAFLAPYPVSVLDPGARPSLLPAAGDLDARRLRAGCRPAEAATGSAPPGRARTGWPGAWTPRPLATRPPHADLSVPTEFDPPAELSEPVVFAAKALAEELHAGLAARGLACVRVQRRGDLRRRPGVTRLWRHDGLLSGAAVAERVRWQLDSWRTAPAAASGPAGGRPRELPARGGPVVGGIVRLRLIPDQLVRDEGRQLALWGETAVSDRVARAATRVQAMLGLKRGHPARSWPAAASPAEQVTLVPFGDAADPGPPGRPPWPGQYPAARPGYGVPARRCPPEVTGGPRAPVRSRGRAAISAPPAWLPRTAARGSRSPPGPGPGR